MHPQFSDRPRSISGGALFKVLEMIYLIPTLITLIAAIPLATMINKMIRKSW